MKIKNMTGRQLARRIIFLDLPCLAAGALRGYFHSQNIPLAETPDFFLKYGPTIAQGTLGLVAGAKSNSSNAGLNEKEAVDYSQSARKGMIAGGILASGAINAGIGALETTLGYQIGQLAGNLQNYFSG